MSDEYYINEDPWFDMSTQAVQFAVTEGEDRFICAIAQATLNDCYGTDDTKENAFDNLEEYEEQVLELAVELIENDQCNGDEIFFIKNKKAKNRLFVSYKFV